MKLGSKVIFSFFILQSMISIIFMLVARDKLCISCILKEEAGTDFQTLSIVKESPVQHHLAKNIVSSLDVTSQKQLGIVSSNRSLESQKKFLPKKDTKGEQLPRKYSLRQRLGPGITYTRKQEQKIDLIKKPSLSGYKLKIRQHQKKNFLTPYKKKSLSLKGDKFKLKSHTYKKLLEVLQPKSKQAKHQFKRIKPLVVNKTDINKSLNPDIWERGRFQQHQILQLCERYKNTKFTFTQFKSVIHSTLFSDNHRLTFCAVKKAGCTVMYTLFLLLQNKYTLQELENVTRITHEDQLQKVVTMDSLPRKLAMRKLSLYFSFTVVRNPLERLVSAYRNKMEEHDGGEDSNYFILKKRIISRQRLLNSSGPSYPTFREFIEYHLKLDFRWWDSHFVPSSYLCQPCLAKYSFYARTKSLDDDVRSVLQLLDIPEEYYFSKQLRDKIPPAIKAHAHNTSSLLFHYYSQLPPDVKKKLFEKLAFELDYYYSLYPSEYGMHLRV